MLIFSYFKIMGVVATSLFCLSAYKRHVSLISSFLVKNKTWMHGWVLYIVSMLHFGYFCNVCTQHQHLIRKLLKCYSRDHWWPLTNMCMYARLFLCSTLKKSLFYLPFFVDGAWKERTPGPRSVVPTAYRWLPECARWQYDNQLEKWSRLLRAHSPIQTWSHVSQLPFLKCRRKSCNFYQVEKKRVASLFFSRNSSQSSLFVGLSTSTVIGKKLRAIKMIIWQADWILEKKLCTFVNN